MNANDSAGRIYRMESMSADYFGHNIFWKGAAPYHIALKEQQAIFPTVSR
jgi:hypothetical protein